MAIPIPQGGKLGSTVIERLQLKAECAKAVEIQAFPEEVSSNLFTVSHTTLIFRLRQELVRLLGPKTGLWLHRVCRGVDDEPVEGGHDQASSGF